MHKCWFPNCNYATDCRSKIDHHHIVPKEVRKSKITIPLCRNHHSLIFCEDSTAGHHSIRTKDSLEILGTFDSTKGKSILYKDTNGKQFYYFPFTGDIWDFTPTE